MKKNHKLFISCLAMGMASCLNFAHAADDAIIFKIHDVVPVKDADGRVVSCELGATFFNRTEAELSNTSLNLIWPDEVVAEAINQEERNERETRRSTRKTSPRYNTATYNTRDVVLNLRLPPLKPNQQVTLKSKIVTDRCFLLLNNVETVVQNCTMTTNQNNKKAVDKNDCKDAFRFIGPKSAEYYYDFKEISLDDIQQQENKQLEDQKNSVDVLYGEVENVLNDVSKSLIDNMPNTKKSKE